jgi:hypothetical protein
MQIGRVESKVRCVCDEKIFAVSGELGDSVGS